MLKQENSTVPDLTIQPTAKFLKAGTIVAALIFLALEILYVVEWRDQVSNWVMVIPPLILLWPLTGWIKRSMRKATIAGDRLRYEVGFTSKGGAWELTACPFGHIGYTAFRPV